MAIVQISRIQLRRGKKNTDSGLPQLASGEMAWAIDEQGLYIGNGAVSEGAPAVGNTKILTEHDNLFELSDQYIYRNGNIDTGNPAITRSLQDRLDDFVSVRAFGATGNGDVQRAELQKAIDELFLPYSAQADADSLKKRVTLKIHAGRYQLDDSLKIPPYATIVGDGSDKTVIEQTVDKPVFEIIAGDGSNHLVATNTSATNQARRIKIEGLTLEAHQNNTGLVVYSTKDSDFDDIKILGHFDVQVFANTQNAQLNSAHTGIYIRGKSASVNTIDNNFRNIKIEKFDYAVRCNDDIENNIFDQGVFTECGMGFVFAKDIPASGTEIGFQITGPLANKISNSRFHRILKQGIWFNKGKGNISENNVFKYVGTDSANDTEPKTPVIEFTSPSPNSSMGDAFYRTEAMMANTSTISNVAYIPEVAGYWTGELEFNVKRNDFVKFTSPTRIMKLPADKDRTYYVDYQYNSSTSNSFRSGTMEIIVDVTNSTSHISDTYDSTGLYSSYLTFSTYLSDENADTVRETLIVQATNPAPVPNAERAELTFKVRAIS